MYKKSTRKRIRKNWLKLLEHLSDGAWHGSDEIEAIIGVIPREVREAVELFGSKLVIGLPGSTGGYRLISAATTDEIKHAYNLLVEVQHRIAKRARALKRVMQEGALK